MTASEAFVAIDCETSGLDPARHEILSLALVGLGNDLEECWVWHETFRPRWPERADPEAMAVNGLGESDWRDARPFAAYARDVADLLRGATLVAHGVAFDERFLRADLDRALGHGHCRWSHRSVCTRSLSLPAMRLLAPDAPRSLGATCKALGVRHDRAHDALSDARAHAGVMRAVMNLWRAPSGPRSVGRVGA